MNTLVIPSRIIAKYTLVKGVNAGWNPASGANFKTNSKMKWNIQRHKVMSSTQELQVSILINEMAETWAYDSETWISSFSDKLKGIPRTNAYSAEFSYKGTPRNKTSLEVWKMKANGDFNYKMFTVTLIKKDDTSN